MILDWVPAHFPRDEWALARFDGSALFEHADPRRGSHPDWGTLIFNFGRLEVRNFLLASALYWLREYHTDGIRVDAVASMLYLDYSRKEGQWVPNEFGGREDLEAVSFLKELNTVAYGREPGIVSAAEESTAWPGVSRPTYVGGLGFGFKWNMGWMHDTLGYFQQDPIHRRYHHHELTFSLVYAFSENFILPLSHDEVVHGKGSMYSQDAGRPLAEARQPARPVRLHVGAPRQEAAVHGLRARPRSRSGATSARWTGTCSRTPRTPASSRWCATSTASTASARRCGRSTTPIAASTGWSPTTPPTTSSPSAAPARTPCATSWRSSATSRRSRARATALGLPQSGRWVEAVNTDSAYYGGSNTGNLGGIVAEETGWGGQPFSAELTLPPLSVLWLVPER